MPSIDSKNHSQEVLLLRPQRWAGIVACLVAGLIGGFAGSFLGSPAHAADQSVYRAQRFELMRPDGQVAAVLGFERHNGDSSAPTLILTRHNHPTILLTADLEGGSLYLDNERDGSEIVLGNTIPSRKGGSWIAIHDSNGEISRVP